MDFNINLFTSPYDQYHIGPNLVPYTTKVSHFNKNNVEGFDNFNNLNNLNNNFIEKLNNSRMDNQRLLYSSEIVSPDQMSHLNVINNQPSYGYNRNVGQWLPDYNLEDQIKKEINMNKKEHINGEHITNANFGNYPKNIYHFPYSLNAAERILNLNSDGLSKSLNATPYEMNYGVGYASGTTDVNATHPIIKGAVLNNGTSEYFRLNKIDNSEICSDCLNKNYKLKNCKNCLNKQRGVREGFENEKIINLLNNNHFLWLLIVILIFICMCQYNDNKKIINELFNMKKTVS